MPAMRKSKSGYVRLKVGLIRRYVHRPKAFAQTRVRSWESNRARARPGQEKRKIQL